MIDTVSRDADVEYGDALQRLRLRRPSDFGAFAHDALAGSDAVSKHQSTTNMPTAWRQTN
jgi:hypothetical protein